MSSNSDSGLNYSTCRLFLLYCVIEAKLFNVISNIRRDYQKEGFTRDSLLDNPIVLFREWFNAALLNEPFDPNAMSLATVNNLGYPSCRIVLLKDISDEGFTFFTNYESRKGLEMESNNRVAATFFWPNSERQVRIRGYVERISDDLSDDYFSSRPLDSQISACVSAQSKSIDSLVPLRELANKIKNENLPIKRPSTWGGYIIFPTKIEFWQGGANRLHTRFEYCLDETSWNVKQLAP